MKSISIQRNSLRKLRVVLCIMVIMFSFFGTAYARFYSAPLGRFMSFDPAEDGLNLYAYCGGRPLNHVDPSGAVRVAIAGITGGGGADDIAYIDRAKANVRWGRTGKWKIAKTAKRLLEHLIRISRRGKAITRLSIFSHGIESGIVLKASQGLYLKSRDGAKSRNLKDLKALIKSGKIKFSKNAVIILYGCNLGDGKFAQRLADITGATVYAAKSKPNGSSGDNGNVKPWKVRGRETGRFFVAGGGQWYKFKRGRKPVKKGTFMRAWW